MGGPNVRVQDLVQLTLLYMVSESNDVLGVYQVKSRESKEMVFACEGMSYRQVK